MNSNQTTTTAWGVRVNADSLTALAAMKAKREALVMCESHRAFEADNCPACGTSRVIN